MSASASLEVARPSPLAVPPGRVPPQNLDAERSVLGGVLLDNAGLNEILEVLKPEDFYREAHRKVFEAMCALSGRGEPIDRVTLKDELTALGAYDAVGGEDFIDLLDKLVPSAANLTYYARIVHEKAIARRVIEAAHAIASQGYEQAGEVGEFLDDAERRIFSITEEKAQSAFTHVREVVKSTFKTIEQLYERQEEITGISTGFADLDRLTSGFQPGDLVILAARPSMGKTSLCLNITTHVGCRAQFRGKRIGVGVFSLEMPKEQLVMRMLASEARVDSQRIRTGRLIESDWPKLAQAAGALADANIHIDDSPSLSALELRAKSRRLAGRFSDSDSPLGLIVVDYLQLMKGNERIDSREQQVSEISRSLKALAKELNIPVLALSQLNRSLEKRPDKRPQLADLRECVTGDTPVLLSDGRRVAICKLVGSEPEVLAMSRSQRIVKARAEKVWGVGPREVYELTLASGRMLRCTARHRLLTGSGWRRVSELSAGARIALAGTIPEPTQVDQWPDARLVLLGHLIGDGSYVVHQPLRYTTASEENSAVVAAAAREEFAAPVKRYPGRGSWHQLVLGGNGNRWHLSGIRAWLREQGIHGQRSHEKRIPAGVFRLGNAQIALLLRHLWATDGSITMRSARQGTIYFSTCSRGLAADVSALLLRLGIVARTCTTLKPGYRPLYGVHVSGAPDQIRFLDSVGGFGPRAEPARKLRAVLSAITPNTNVDTLPIEVFDLVRERMGALGITQRRMADMRGTSYGGNAHFAFAPSRAVVAGYAELLDDVRLLAAAKSDLFWDRLVSIVPAGIEEVFDLTVPGLASWLADGIVSHNSGALEQDADTILFLFREEVYEKDKEEVKGIAELIVGKQRNGPIGSANAAFLHEFTRFENLARDYVPRGRD